MASSFAEVVSSEKLKDVVVVDERERESASGHVETTTYEVACRNAAGGAEHVAIVETLEMYKMARGRVARLLSRKPIDEAEYARLAKQGMARSTA